MKLLVVNPNSSETVTSAIMDSAKRGASAGTKLVGVTTKGGTRNIDSAFGDYLSGAFMIRTCLEAVEVHKPDAVVLAGFGRAAAEVGAVIIVGGNIDGVTRVMTTAIALETSKGDLPLALGLGVVLIALVLALNAAAHGIKEAAQRRYG